MGCCGSTNTAVQPLRPEEVNGDEDETGSKVDGRGDSAVSKGTTDSGVVMENREIPVLPGAVPRKLPPLTGVRESEVDGLRPKSSEILEELLNQGIIPVGQTRERGSGAGEAYSIILDDGEGVRRRPPARLESLKANKMQNLRSREDIEEKIRLAEERRKLKEDELKTRLRTKSARVRGPAPTSSTEEDKNAALTTPVEPLHHPLTTDSQDPPLHSQIAREEAEGGERVREAAGDGRECREKTDGADRRAGREEGVERGDNRGEAAERVCEDSDGEEEEEEEEEELTRVEELENDSSFQHEDDKEELF